jgi:hypothetical protein
MLMGLAAATPLRATVSFLFWAGVFALVYCQAPLYYSNQNQYFLHGLADGGLGFLDADWLANTADPTPVFSWLVAATYRYLHPYAFYVYYGVLFGIYFLSMVSLFRLLVGNQDTLGMRLGFIALLLLVHSALARWCSYRWFGLDYPWYFQAGVAGQYVLGAMFQPSAFGTLLILSIALFVRGRPLWAVACAGLAAVFHSTYLLGAGLLTLAYLAVLLAERQPRQALRLGALALVPVVPLLGYVWATFRPASPAVFTEAQAILVNVRIPHHTIPALWCDPIAVGQIAWVLLGLFLVRGTRLFPVLGVPLVLSAGLTLLQVATDNDTLALLFPWRASVFLVPVATTIILSRLVLAGARWFQRPLVQAMSVTVIAGLAVAGLAIMVQRLGFQMNDDELPVMNYVKEHATQGDVYLLPVRLPNLAASTRGSLSSDFKPIAAKKTDARLIPVDFQRFRLYTGVPVFVDFKSIPYKDTDVLEWYSRMQRTEAFDKQLRAGRSAQAADDLRRAGITHVLATADAELACPGLEEVYADRFYRVYRLVK